jgi:hypothetical protein
MVARVTPRALPLALVLAALAGPARAGLAPSATIPVSAIRAGQHAEVRTVFAGDSIETFGADIIGVLASGRAAGDVILARATDPRVVASGIAAGMSGSPVYVDGKLAGALALGWPFSKEPIFGITPIAEMLPVLAQPEGTGGASAGPEGLEAAARGTRYRGLVWADDTLMNAPATAPAAGAPAALPIPLTAGGLSPRALEICRPLFEGTGLMLTPGGRAAPTTGAPAPIVPGSAIAVDVMRGDLDLSAIGTVTYVDGDKILIFGHPFFQAGEVRMPLSSAHIVGILPSLYDSFKLGVPGAPVGVATQDRRTAVGGRLGGSAHLMPLAVVVSGTSPAPQSYRFESLDDRLLMPQLLATAVMSSLLESGGTGPQQTLDWSVTAWHGAETLHLHDRTAGDTPYNDVVAAISGPLRFLLGTSYGPWRPDSVHVAVAATAGRTLWTVRGASVLAASVRPGGHVRARVELERWHGGGRLLELDVAVPGGLPNGRYSLWIGGGSEFDRLGVTRLPARYRPTSVADGVRRLEALKPSDALYTGLWAKAAEVTRDGEDYPDLPLSAMPLLAPAQSADERIRRADWALLSESSQPFDGVVHGEAMLDVYVDDRAP